MEKQNIAIGKIGQNVNRGQPPAQTTFGASRVFMATRAIINSSLAFTCSHRKLSWMCKKVNVGSRQLILVRCSAVLVFVCHFSSYR